jgi:hypothetical protein
MTRKGDMEIRGSDYGRAACLNYELLASQEGTYSMDLFLQQFLRNI